MCLPTKNDLRMVGFRFNRTPIQSVGLMASMMSLTRTTSKRSTLLDSWRDSSILRNCKVDDNARENENMRQKTYLCIYSRDTRVVAISLEFHLYSARTNARTSFRLAIQSTPQIPHRRMPPNFCSHRRA